MDFFSLLRMFGALAFVLGMLAGALWLVRRYDIRLPGRVGAAREQRLEIVERITIDQRRSLLLIRRDGQEHLLLLSPEGHVVVDRAAADGADGPVPPYAMLMAQAIERLWQRVGEDNARRTPTLEVASA
ncbi:FliO/MopB family protein [Sphingobium sp. B2]|uniref:FliO/MopB family protein n=1 Tax=Sphingobium sp. B2 TaxID=2583228 RepID=UPI0011A890A3|nr:flagellar biosynthetic protein FliO [Sphingobium sp. B2]